jgi:hypothetical protein
MAADSAHLSSRTTTVLAVAAAHGLVVWLIWRVAVPLPIEPEAFTSVLFWIPATEPARLPSAAHPRVAATRALRPPSFTPAPAPDSGTATTYPPTPGAHVAGRAALPGAAAAELDEEKRTGEQVRALTRRYVVEDDPRNPHPGPTSGFRWYDAGIHRIDTRAFIPGLWVSDHCVLIAFVLPACMIGHIEIHGDLFEGAALVHDARLATPRPNDVP